MDLLIRLQASAIGSLIVFFIWMIIFTRFKRTIDDKRRVEILYRISIFSIILALINLIIIQNDFLKGFFSGIVIVNCIFVILIQKNIVFKIEM
jgi:hypothetical protein